MSTLTLGKSLIFIKLIEEFGLSFDITNNQSQYITIRFWRINNPDEKECWSVDRHRYEDFWGMLIDIVIERRYTTDYQGVLKKELKDANN